MTEQYPSQQQDPATIPPPAPGAYPPPPAAGMQAYAPGQPAYAPQYGPVGHVRSTGMCILLAIVTLGIYAWIWYYKTHEEMKAHTNQGLGGPVALLLTIFVGIVMPYITASEVGSMYRRDGKAAPVSGTTGLWYFPGMFILVGPIIWFVKTNGALNDYWKSKGAVA